MDRFYRSRLPHWQPGGGIFFVTFRLFGSPPTDNLARIAEERRLLLRGPRNPDEAPRDRALRMSARLFALAEDYLDKSSSDAAGKFALNDPRVAAMVCDEIYARDGLDSTSIASW